MADQACSVCLSQFREPKILPCCHTFCLKCLERTAKTATEITCPICRKTHAIPAGGLREFLTDFIVSHEVEVSGLKSSSTKKTEVCGECEVEGPVESYCRDCQAYLCRECSTQAHKKLRSYRGHKVIPVQELSAATLQSSKVYHCSTHSSEVLKLYCETCGTLICRDCTLVDHHQHKYKFVQDGRVQINDQLMLLVKDGKERLTTFKANLGEIQKVETTAASYPEVCKADVNAYFDAVIQLIERRRQQLLLQVETEGQKDLKQIWADKYFHQTAICRFDAALGLASKACKCTSDVEMILTAQQSIKQLSQLKEVEWDASTFITVASSPGKFTEGTRLEASTVGCIERASFNNIKIQNLPTTAELGQTITFKVVQTLLDGRSKQRICLQNPAVITKANIQVLVKYGHSQKPHENVSILQDPETTGSVVVSVRLVCGGKHSIEIEFAGKPINGSPFTLTVTGTPDMGTRVRHGPDWKEQRRGVICMKRPRRRKGLVQPTSMAKGSKTPHRDANEERTVENFRGNQYQDANEEGTVQTVQNFRNYQYDDPFVAGLYGQREIDGQYAQAASTTATVTVLWGRNQFESYQGYHNWGDTYEIELI